MSLTVCVKEILRIVFIDVHAYERIKDDKMPSASIIFERRDKKLIVFIII